MSADTTHDEAALRQRYTLRYLGALALICATILLGAWQVNHVLEVNRQQTEIVDVASAQRMLSQRLALLVPRVLDAPNAFRQARALHDMRLSVERMREGITYLTTPHNNGIVPIEATQALRDHYDTSRGGLLTTAEGFISRFEAFVEDPEANAPMMEFHRMNAETDLIVRFDQAVALFTEHAQEQINESIRVHGTWVLISIALLIFEILFIFRPMARDAAQSVAQIRDERDKRATMLSRSMKIARMGHWRAENPQADPIWMSRELLDIYGMDCEEGDVPLSVIQAGDIVDDGTPIEQNEQHLAFREAWETGEPVVANSQFRKPNGEIMDMIVYMEAEFDDAGKVCAVTGVIKDSTEEAKAERALRESYAVIERKSQDLIEAQRLGKTATWRLPLHAQCYEWDENTFELLRFDAEAFSPTRDNVRRLYVKNSFEEVGKSHQRLLQCERLLPEEASSSLEVQMTRGDGSLADVRVTSKLETNEDGHPIALFGTVHDISAEKAAERELEQLAYYDNLTGLANRTLFSRELKRACEAAADGHCDMALLLIDLDHFKEVNDTLGHAAGDQLLGVVGQRLSKIVGHQHFVARLGGDEFGILVRDNAERQALDALCQQVIDEVSQAVKLSLGEVQTYASIGIARAPEDSLRQDELMRFADLALYSSKESGRGCASYYDPSFSEAMGARLSLAHDIRQALKNETFEAHFQPLVAMDTGKVSGFETLLRLPHPEKGYIPPDEFIPVAESSHLIADLGSFVLHAACREAKAWIDAGLPRRYVAVNVSAAQVWHGDLEQVIDSALETSGLDPKLLCIELTESVFAADSLDRLKGILTRLKERGVLLALDDFGTGYSSLSYLSQLPFDTLKIDRAFVTGADLCAEKRKMLQGVFSLGRGLGLRVVAEGVETESELLLVERLGCDVVQGWLYGKAQLPEKAVIEAGAIDSSAMLGPLRKTRQQKRHHDAVMGALLRRTG
jgi:diguanylate cyclase (GGDEF)-like protein